MHKVIKYLMILKFSNKALTFFYPSASIWINEIILSYQERWRDRPFEASAADQSIGTVLIPGARALR